MVNFLRDPDRENWERFGRASKTEAPVIIELNKWRSNPVSFDVASYYCQILIHRAHTVMLSEEGIIEKDEAKEILLKNVEEQIKEELMSRINKLEKESSETIDDKARDLLAGSMQRLVSSYTPEISTTTVDLPSDEMKGRIIGREGRNIKVIEQLTGTEIIVDDTPNVITISGFSPIRRHIAKRTLDRLILDGRIHPTKIEEAIEEKDRTVDIVQKESSEKAVPDDVVIADETKSPPTEIEDQKKATKKKVTQTKVKKTDEANSKDEIENQDVSKDKKVEKKKKS